MTRIFHQALEHNSHVERRRVRPGLNEQEAGDLAAALTRVEVYRIVSGELGWSHDRITEVLTTVLRSAVLG